MTQKQRRFSILATFALVSLSSYALTARAQQGKPVPKKPDASKLPARRPPFSGAYTPISLSADPPVLLSVNDEATIDTSMDPGDAGSIHQILMDQKKLTATRESVKLYAYLIDRDNIDDLGNFQINKTQLSSSTLTLTDPSFQFSSGGAIAYSGKVKLVSKTAFKNRYNLVILVADATLGSKRVVGITTIIVKK